MFVLSCQDCSQKNSCRDNNLIVKYRMIMKKTIYIILALCGVGLIVWGLLAEPTKPARGLSSSPSPLPELASTTPTFTLASPVFLNSGLIPAYYTCDMKSTRPPSLLISGAPEGAKSFVLIMEDYDGPAAANRLDDIKTFVHWVFYDIPGDTTEIVLGTTTGGYGITSANGTDYIAPCPPKDLEPREHRYVFTLYALNSNELGFGSAPSAQRARTALAPHLLAETRLIGRYAGK